MKKHKDLIYQMIIVLFLIFLFFLINLLTNSSVLFGSKTDWISQHTVFPEYLRNLFYDTGNLFPNFAPHIGAGQNIYALSYYGLLNPIILVSYMLPNVSMIDYLVFSNYLLLTATGLLFYRFLRNHKKESTIAFVTTLFLLCTSCLFYHFHRHFMFVNYMPFLILGLMGIDRYFKTNQKWLYMISTFLMIMMSYYYSVTGIFVMVIYGIYQYIKLHKKIQVKQFLIDGVRFIFPILIAICMSAILLLPTFHMILNGRTSESISINVFSLFLPDLNLDGILYDPYCLGFTAIILFALLEIIRSKKLENRYLGITILVVLIFPLFDYLLNGTLYIRDKILLPFLPLLGLVLAEFLVTLKEKKMHTKYLYIFTLGIVLLAIITKQTLYFFYLDMAIMWIILFVYYKFGFQKICISIALLVAFFNFFLVNASENYVTVEDYRRIFSSEKQKLITNTLKKEPDLVRSNQLDDPLDTINKIYSIDYYQTSIYSSIYNANYRNFYEKEFGNALSHRNNLITSQNNNILYQMLMGVKYVTTTKKAPVGYHKKVSLKDGVTLYQNDQVLPLGYVSYQTLSESVFDHIPFPYRDEVLLKQTITKSSRNKKYETNIKEVDLNYNLIHQEDDIHVSKTEKGYQVKATKTGLMQLKLDHSLNSKILMIQFDVKNQPSCASGDLRVTINQVKNKLTCAEWIYQNNNNTFHYVISSSKSTATLMIGFDPGVYDIENIKTYELEYDEIKNIKAEKDEWQLDKKKSKGDVLTGKITAKEDGYFTTSIPYDEGFTVIVDGKEVAYEMVNKGFLGFSMKKGYHTVTLKYQAPWFKAGVILSTIGILFFLLVIIIDRKKSLK